ncbi:MAG: cation diffusion facilitator family transporter [Alphaproteobacteria bacterium]|nr:cation diffusion facilitator family transporter [Alphaproteobacteria bacterium]
MPAGKDDGRLMRLATYASVGTALTLVTVKIGAWAVTDSVALLSSLVDSLLDLAASLLNLLAVRQALQPADREHRFGHGKAEPLSGLGQAAFIAGSAVFLSFEAVQRLFHPVPLATPDAGIAVMLFSIAVTLGLVRFQKYVVARTRSVAIAADKLHYAGDILINLGVIAALLASKMFGWSLLDPLFALAIAVYLLISAWRIMGDSLTLLMDHELAEAERERIIGIVASRDGALAVHDLRTRSSGPRCFIQLHVEMERDLPLWRAHEIADAVEKDLMEAFPHAEVMIHQDPSGLVENHPDFSFETPPRA